MKYRLELDKMNFDNKRRYSIGLKELILKGQTTPAGLLYASYKELCKDEPDTVAVLEALTQARWLLLDQYEDLRGT